MHKWLLTIKTQINLLCGSYDRYNTGGEDRWIIRSLDRRIARLVWIYQDPDLCISRSVIDRSIDGRLDRATQLDRWIMINVSKQILDRWIVRSGRYEEKTALLLFLYKIELCYELLLFVVYIYFSPRRDGLSTNFKKQSIDLLIQRSEYY